MQSKPSAQLNVLRESELLDSAFWTQSRHNFLAFRRSQTDRQMQHVGLSRFWLTCDLRTLGRIGASLIRSGKSFCSGCCDCPEKYCALARSSIRDANVSPSMITNIRHIAMPSIGGGLIMRILMSARTADLPAE